MKKPTTLEWIGIFLSALAAAAFAAFIIHILSRPISISHGVRTWSSSGAYGPWSIRETFFQLLTTIIAVSFVYHLTILPFIRSHNRRTIVVLTTLVGPVLAICIFASIIILYAFIEPSIIAGLWELLVLLLTKPTQATTDVVGLLILYSIIAAVSIVFTVTAALLASKSDAPALSQQNSPNGKSAARGFAMIAIITLPLIYLWISEFKKGSDRAACIMNIRNVQQATRGHNGMNNIGTGPAPGFSKHSLIGPGKFFDKEPICPGGGTYSWIEPDRAPDIGELMLRCSHPDHIPENHKDW